MDKTYQTLTHWRASHEQEPDQEVKEEDEMNRCTTTHFFFCQMMSKHTLLIVIHKLIRSNVFLEKRESYVNVMAGAQSTGTEDPNAGSVKRPHLMSWKQKQLITGTGYKTTKN